MLTATRELVTVERIDADMRCDGLGVPPCPAVLSFTMDDDVEPPREFAAREASWWSDGTVDICSSCRRQPWRHVYVEPTSGPRWDRGCKLCNGLPEDHPEAGRG